MGFRPGQIKKIEETEHQVDFERRPTGSNAARYRQVIPSGISLRSEISYAHRGLLIFINLSRAQRERERERGGTSSLDSAARPRNHYNVPFFEAIVVAYKSGKRTTRRTAKRRGRRRARLKDGTIRLTRHAAAPRHS